MKTHQQRISEKRLDDQKKKVFLKAMQLRVSDTVHSEFICAYARWPGRRGTGRGRKEDITVRPITYIGPTGTHRISNRIET
jgi:hypothetical protein